MTVSASAARTQPEVLSIFLLLERIEQLVRQAPPVPLGGRVMVRADQVLEVLERIREALPEELETARAMAATRDEWLARSQAEAEAVVARAEEYAARLVQESQVVQAGRRQADQLLVEATRRVQELQTGANEYADGVLGVVQEVLEKSLEEVQRYLQQVRRGRQELAQRLSSYAAADQAPASTTPPADAAALNGRPETR